MRLVTGISIATLAVAVAALALVLWLVVTEPWEPDVQAATPDVQSANEEHTQELDPVGVFMLIRSHVSQLVEPEGFTGERISDDDYGRLEKYPGFLCFWYSSEIRPGGFSPDPNPWHPDDAYLTYNYMEKDDVWLVTSVRPGCENNYETWTIDDNTGAITYGRLP